MHEERSHHKNINKEAIIKSIHGETLEHLMKHRSIRRKIDNSCCWLVLWWKCEEEKRQKRIAR